MLFPRRSNDNPFLALPAAIDNLVVITPKQLRSQERLPTSIQEIAGPPHVSIPIAVLDPLILGTSFVSLPQQCIRTVEIRRNVSL